jgi:hypothetical protein
MEQCTGAGAKPLRSSSARREEGEGSTAAVGSRQRRGAPAASECGDALLPTEKRNRAADGGCSRQARLTTLAAASESQRQP